MNIFKITPNCDIGVSCNITDHHMIWPIQPSYACISRIVAI